MGAVFCTNMAKKGHVRAQALKKMKRIKTASWVEGIMIMLALVSALLLFLEFTTTLALWQVQLFDFVDLCIALVFLGEFSFKLLLAKNPKKFFEVRWWELLAAVPITTPLTQALRLLRLLRLLHLAEVTVDSKRGTASSREVTKKSRPDGLGRC